MTAKTDTPSPAERLGLGETATYDELVESPPLPGYAAFDPKTKERCFVLEELEEPAGRCRMDSGGVLTEWCDCGADETVYRVVAYADLRGKPEDWQSLEHVLDAVAHGRVLDCAMPESRLAPLVPGVDEKIREVRR